MASIFLLRGQSIPLSASPVQSSPNCPPPLPSLPPYHPIPSIPFHLSFLSFSASLCCFVWLDPSFALLVCFLSTSRIRRRFSTSSLPSFCRHLRFQGKKREVVTEGESCISLASLPPLCDSSHLRPLCPVHVRSSFVCSRRRQRIEKRKTKKVTSTLEEFHFQKVLSSSLPTRFDSLELLLTTLTTRPFYFTIPRSSPANALATSPEHQVNF